MRIWCGRILVRADCALSFDMGRRKRKGLRRTNSASSAGGERRCRPRGQSFCGRRDCADAAQARRRGRGRYSAPVHAPACADGCAGLRRAQRRCAEWRRDVPRQRASCNRGLHRPQSGTDRCEKPRTAKRPPPKAIFRLSGNAPQKAKLSEGRFGKAEPEGCASIRGRTQRGVRFSRGSTVGPMQPADSGTASRTERQT